MKGAGGIQRGSTLRHRRSMQRYPFFTLSLCVIFLLQVTNIRSAPNDCDPERPYLYQGSMCIKGRNCPSAGFAKYVDNTGNATCSPCPTDCAECGFEENSNGVLTYCRTFCEAVARRPLESNQKRNWYPSNSNWDPDNPTKYCNSFTIKDECNNGTVKFYHSKMSQICWWDFTTESSSKCQPTNFLVSGSYPAAFSHKKDVKCCGECLNCKFGLYLLASKVECVPDCPEGQFVSQEYSSSGSNGSCAYCTDNCASCTSFATCLNCTNGTFVAFDNSSCVATCADGYSPVNGRCQVVHVAPSPAPTPSSAQSFSPSSSSTEEDAPQIPIDKNANETKSLNEELPQDISTLSAAAIADQMSRRQAIANSLFSGWMQAWLHTVNRSDMIGFISQTVLTLTSLTAYSSLLNDYTKSRVLELLGSMFYTATQNNMILGVLALEGAADATSNSAVLSNASSIRTVKAVVDLIGQAFLLTVDIDGPQKTLHTEAFTMSVRSKRGLGTTSSATLNARDSVVTFPSDLGGATLSNLPSNAVIDAQLLEWSVDIYEELQEQKTNSPRSRTLVNSYGPLNSYRPKTPIISVSLSHNGSNLDIKSTHSYIDLQLKRQVADNRSQAERRQNTLVTDYIESLVNVTCVPGSRIRVNSSCVADDKPKVFGFKQNSRFIKTETNLISDPEQQKASLCDSDIQTFSCYVCVAGTLSMISSLCFAVYYRNWDHYLDCIYSKDTGQSTTSDIRRVGQNNPKYKADLHFVNLRYQRKYLPGRNVHLGWKERKYYDTGVRFVIWGGCALAMFAATHLATCGPNFVVSKVTQRVIAYAGFSIILTLCTGGLLMFLLILPCLAPETCRFEASQRRRDIYPILMLFSSTTLIPSLVFGTMLLVRGSVAVLGESAYIDADFQNPAKNLNTSRENNLFSVSPDGEWIICDEVEPVNLTISCLTSSVHNGNSSDNDTRTAGKLSLVTSSTEMLCSYWNEFAEGGGAWSGDGCKFANESNDMISCKCNHLTDFSAGTGETYETLNKIFANNNLHQIFTVHWYVFALIMSFLGIFAILACYGHHYDSRVTRRSRLESALLASVFANKMLSRLSTRRYNNRSRQYSKVSSNDKTGILQGKNALLEDISINRQSMRSGHMSSSKQLRKHQPRKLSDGTRKQSWYKDYRRTSIHYNNFLGLTGPPGKEVPRGTRQQSRLTFMCCRRFCAVLCHRMLHEHDVFEICFVNNRWYTRIDRIMVLLTRLTLKVSVCAIFFLWSRNFGTFRDLYGQGEGDVDFFGKTVAVACSFIINKIFGAFFRGLFVFLAAKRRRHLYESLIKAADNMTPQQFDKSDGKQINRNIQRLEAEAMVARHRGEYHAGHLWEPLLKCICHRCTSSEFLLRLLSAVVWTTSFLIVGFLLFFNLSYGFALSDAHRVEAWLESACISCGIWLCLTTPLKILVKTTCQICKQQRHHGKTCLYCWCCGRFCNCRNPEKYDTKPTINNTTVEAEMKNMKLEMKVADVSVCVSRNKNTLSSEESASQRRRRGQKRATAQYRTRPSKAEPGKDKESLVGISVEDHFEATRSRAFSPEGQPRKQKRWSLFTAESEAIF